jgi:ABC-type tungstate transport system permease subunit
MDIIVLAEAMKKGNGMEEEPHIYLYFQAPSDDRAKSAVSVNIDKSFKKIGEKLLTKI